MVDFGTIDINGNAYNKCIKVINSCLIPEHLEVACRMVMNYSDMFGNQTWTTLDLFKRLEAKSRLFYLKYHLEGGNYVQKGKQKASCGKNCK